MKRVRYTPEVQLKSHVFFWKLAFEFLHDSLGALDLTASPIQGLQFRDEAIIKNHLQVVEEFRLFDGCIQYLVVSLQDLNLAEHIPETYIAKYDSDRVLLPRKHTLP